ncbi:ATP-binding cassette domain-containing protein [Sphaerisporangium fuscum]|uniref:ATP-binding cassette domain-containing protein n=1 Tax=Sphaerisporangium fuscum TaxID=2835868 RepID=UPI002029A688|nr:ATP-binding cassette domain-containing protein [Sphaerisporangium fuscum]
MTASDPAKTAEAPATTTGEAAEPAEASATTVSEVSERASGAAGTVAAPVLSVEGLKVSIGAHDILHGVDITLMPGRVHGLAGESGSGKTMTGLATLGLLPHGARTSGRILLEGRNLLDLPQRELNKVRGREVAMVFQDPATSLHPMLSIGRQLTEHMRHHLGLGKAEARARAIELLGQVRIPGAAAAVDRYPHQFSGGMRQRIAIAVALACGPKVLIADEPTTALDVTVQAGVLRLLRSLCDDLGLAVLLVTHDLGVMSAVADEVSVMKDGLVVETGPRGKVLRDPEHPYTRALLDALPKEGSATASTETGEAVQDAETDKAAPDVKTDTTDETVADVKADETDEATADAETDEAVADAEIDKTAPDAETDTTDEVAADAAEGAGADDTTDSPPKEGS